MNIKDKNLRTSKENKNIWYKNWGKQYKSYFEKNF